MGNLEERTLTDIDLENFRTVAIVMNAVSGSQDNICHQKFRINKLLLN